ncbi:saccharopine dehydrogenase NADP-binding domain-containing protein [bacterium]|nr:saccharopine dehydrogenase NADP-binding domain-containing protein [bacterium]MCI0603476.1 saccharopine dehydrogenase NADP-binding domain-containing protein [bacterium]
MKFQYAVIGAGRQGTAAAYDLAKNGEARRVILADANLQTALTSAARVNKLLANRCVEGATLDVRDRPKVIEFLRDVDSVVSAVPYYFNLDLARCAVESRTPMCDLGGNTEIVFQELELNDAAKSAGITLVPDCGMVPGLGTSVCMYAMSLIEEPEEVYLWDGGLPQHPEEPWKYILTFHFEGLVNEYFGTTEFLRDGKLITVDSFQEYETVLFPEPVGELEAFTTAGGTSTAPRTFLGKLKVYQNKTLRYKGHFAQWKTLHDAGLLDDDPVNVNGTQIRPRDLLAAVLDPKIRAKAGDKDVCIIRALCSGKKDGKRARATVDLFDYYDESTRFTAMERTTGWHAAIVAGMLARGEIAKGAVPVELAATGHEIMNACRDRGMKINEIITSGAS